MNEKSIVDPFVIELFQFRKVFFGAIEKQKAKDYCYEFCQAFQHYSMEDRQVWIFISFEIEEVRDKYHFKLKCAKYDNGQPLFTLCPKLWDNVLNGDLINAEMIEYVANGRVLKFENGYSIIDSELNPNILFWARETFPLSAQFVRLPPYKIWKNLPLQPLLEATLIPANPNWWKNLDIYKYNREVASYILEEGLPQDNLVQYLDFKVKKVRRLEVYTHRDNQGLLSMMIEELQEKSDGHWIGRCIHLDTYAKMGTPFNLAKLKHLDLAINLYFDSDIQERLKHNLASGGKVQDASCRTHLFRINEVPFTALLEFCKMFFVSSTLLSEWVVDQFEPKVACKTKSEK